ncbi:hypothetical protein [Cohnella sp.]|uniref:hypothetical protein n=1 Tax=Cohnella sp. TaxID=1883426 RepID=UPI003566644A
MGTRLLIEQLIKRHYPRLRYVRAHTTGRNTATLYAWNEDLELPAADAAELKRFAAGHLAPYVCYRVKAYSKLQEDLVPRERELPEPIMQAATNRILNPSGIAAVMNGLLEKQVLTFRKYDYCSNTIHFEVRTAKERSEIEEELVQRCLSELIPLGARCELVYCAEE